MGMLSRSVSIMRYRIKGEVEGQFWDVIQEGVRIGGFKQIETSGDEVGLGWTSINDFTENASSRTDYVYGNYVALTLRVDTVRVPSKILEMELKKEARKLMDELGVARLGSGRRRELKERLKEALKTQVFPSIQTFDMIWDTSKELVYFGSHGVKARERFEDHFKRCFGLSLLPLLAYMRGLEMLPKAERPALEALKPFSMVL